MVNKLPLPGGKAMNPDLSIETFHTMSFGRRRFGWMGRLLSTGVHKSPTLSATQNRLAAVIFMFSLAVAGTICFQVRGRRSWLHPAGATSRYL